MWRILLAKDFRRARHNPVPWLTNLIIPLSITALIGLAFGGKSDSGALGRIRFAVVDEDKTPLTDFLRGAANQRDGAEHLEPVFLDRAAAMRQINANQISAVLIIPTNFTRSYLTGRAPVSLELIKNPAESIHPAVLEELLGALVTGMNAVARSFRSELPSWQAVFEGKGDYRRIAALIERAGDKVQTVKQYVDPPLVWYTTETGKQSGAAGQLKNGGSKNGQTQHEPVFNLFGYLLVGMAGMFLLFLASIAMTDLHRELRQRTFQRYHTLHQRLTPFVAGKVVFCVATLLLCAAVMLGGGGLLFRIHWHQLIALTSLTATYACFAAALMAVLVALVPNERHADVLQNIAAMGLGLAGGCAFPPQQLPVFMRHHITPSLPSFWYTDAVRNLEFGGGEAPWILVVIKLAVLTALLIALAAFLFHRKFRAGLHT